MVACVTADSVRADGDLDEGIVEEYLLAREEVDAELEEFYETAKLGDIPDPNSDAMVRLRKARDDLTKAKLAPKHLADLLKDDPGLNIGQTRKFVLNKSVQKRTIEAKEYRRWTKGIVPYVFTGETNEGNRIEIIRSIRTYERFTCIRYIPWKEIDGVTTNQENDLGHESYLTFVKRGGCWSFQGNIRKKTGGQLISCCGGVTCIHEIGHAMGESHEHQTPNPDRDRMIRVNFAGIVDGKTNMYVPHNPTSVFSMGYDLSSYMHYAPWSFAKSGKKTFYKFFPELPHKNSYYYLMREVSLMHKCQDRCSESAMTCENDGYLTLVDNKCACRCIPGLDPATGCTTVYKNDPVGLEFPGGQYALPAHSSGCPDNTFSFGLRVQINDGGNSKSVVYDLGGDVSGKKVEQQFCVKDSSNKEFFWPGGNFCIYRRGGKCPDGFTGGFVQYDDHPTQDSSNSQSGELPDGVFDDDTRFEYCCTNSGFSGDELYLPSRKPFALIKRVGKNCQKVRGMHYEANNLIIDNAAEEIAARGGDHPVYKEDTKTQRYFTSFCMYKPAMIDCGDIITLDDSNPEVTIISPRDPELECYWLIKAPPGERLQLDFSEFEIKGVPGSCLDDLEVRYVRMGQPGVNFCGRRWDKTTISVNNTIHMRLSTYGDSTSHFTATIKLVKRADLCYAASDRGMTYAGDVSFSRNFEPCLPWHKMTHCEMHPFKENKFTLLLEGNKCRNPDQATGFQPWCYVKEENCIRNYCDVCLIGKRYNLLDDCAERIRLGQCDLRECAKTCAHHYPEVPQPVPASQITCGTPAEDVPDGSLNEATKTSYAVGESVTYKCKEGSSSQVSFCLSTGEWSFLGTACSECPPNFSPNFSNRQCYLYVNSIKTFPEASSYCQEKKAIVAFPASEDENTFLKSFTRFNIWIGITDEAEEGNFVTVLGKPAAFTNWKAPEPNNYGNREDCTEIRHDKFWNDLPCSPYKRRFVCQIPMTDLKVCADFSDKCTENFELYPLMCTNFTTFAEQQCRFTCGLCNQDDTPKCTVGEAGATTEISRGMIATSTCPEGLARFAGDEVRGCRASGSLTGSPLKCHGTCPSGWAFNFDTMSCYKKFDTQKTHADAQADCVSHRGTLTTSVNMKENKFIRDLMGPGKSPFVWLGLTDTKTEGKFVWMDGTLPTFTYWYGREPNDWGRYGEDCAHLLHNGQWNDNRCSKKFKYICKVPLDNINGSR
ncbi:metalloendopeptidase [Plakobranchus ocellatus]|uniref:Metalloendopeptidase n=1 Tax=Plakobranchus ocellatus TaxID=259542 RepID=A0AAV3Z1W7_9GAST|nr:metalloendopeptidase [Plakobranchus ocellatus]